LNELLCCGHTRSDINALPLLNHQAETFKSYSPFQFISENGGTAARYLPSDEENSKES
jgi:hypothetical protein